MIEIGFGGGCHWCTEAVFQHLRGVEIVAQGFMRSEPPHDSFSEAVRVTFDPKVIPLTVLIDIHLRTHSSQSAHKMRGKYRSAIYSFDEVQKIEAKHILARLQPDFDKALITQVLPHKAFRPSKPQFQNYYKTGPEKPFCKSYIDPKLKLLREQYSNFAAVVP